ncbi:MAG TPA: DUF4332 domain-containing protein [Longimicrobiales bacterium]|nr:DUF4332 domain-containing protein [Longimicrobiales bacterium]
MPGHYRVAIRRSHERWLVREGDRRPKHSEAVSPGSTIIAIFTSMSGFDLERKDPGRPPRARRQTMRPIDGRAGAWLTLAGAALIIAVATPRMLRGEEPWATWFYVLVWYPTLLAADATLRLRSGRWYLLGDGRFVAGLLVWSVPFWLFFELVNFRVANWYYVFLPADGPLRWTGITLSFATVLPAIVVSRRLLAGFGFVEGLTWRPVRMATWLPTVLQLAGIGFFLAALAWPRVLFPLIWGGVTLFVDPWVYRRDPKRSLVGAIERGEPALIVQLLVGGLAIGLLWELYNVGARGKWIYTVTGLEELKLFEMPLLGFLGFPVLALDGWAVWSALVVARLAVDPGSPTGSGAFRSTAAVGALTLGVSVSCAAVLAGMERWTITSVTPTLEEVAGPAAPRLEAAGYDVFSLAGADPDGLELATGSPDASTWVRRARLMVLRGIGAENALRLEAAGVTSIAELAAADPEELMAALMDAGAPHIRAARVRVWVKGARELR